ncbi:hypothetical protein DFH09DRAFT_1185610 [Mycena vulgaris]|nr:hypothetical protein DFH09DRAFT_1185610 [Mycena vulgaris]
MTLHVPDSNPPPDYVADPMKDPKKEKDATSSVRYIYYRVYTPDGAIPSKSASDPANPFVGRIAARSVPPPHTVMSLKRCCAHAENLTDPAGSRTVLYLNPTAPAPMSNVKKVTIRGPDILNGSTPETAYALVLTEELTVLESQAVNAIQIGDTLEGSQYLYYQLFTRVGEDTSKVSFNPNEPAVGRIEKIHVSPPHTPATIKRCIAKAEGKAIYAYAELYQDISSQSAMVDGNHISLMNDRSDGSAEDNPIVLVQPERRAGLYNRPVRVINNYRRQHAVVGEMGHTDGIVTGLGYKCVFPHRGGDTEYFKAGDIKFLDE